MGLFKKKNVEIKKDIENEYKKPEPKQPFPGEQYISNFTMGLDENMARDGYPDSMFRMGLYSLYGVTPANTKRMFPQDFKDAVTWFSKATEKNHPDALYYLGLCYEWGYGVYRDFDKALSLYKKAANLNNINAQKFLKAIDYSQDNNDVIAFNLWKELSDFHLEAVRRLVDCYIHGKGTTIDYSMALKYINIGTKANDSFCIFTLGYCYSHGFGVECDLEKARELFKLSEEKGYKKAKDFIESIDYIIYKEKRDEDLSMAQHLLSNKEYEKAIKISSKYVKNNDSYAKLIYAKSYYYLSQIEEEQDAIKSINFAKNYFLSLAKDSPDNTIKSEAIRYLGLCNENGPLGDRDILQALKHYQTSMALGHKPAIEDYIKVKQQLNINQLFKMGEYYLDLKEYSAAYDLLVSAAELGHKSAYSEVARLYRDGLGVNKNINKAIEWYEKGVAAGSADAMYDYALELYTGKFIEEDLNKSLKLLKDSYDLGLTESTYPIGLMYEKGFGTDIDLEKALTYYMEAASLGYDTQEQCERVKNAISNLSHMSDNDKGQVDSHFNLDEELDKIVGLEAAKKVIKRLNALLIMQEERKKRGFKVNNVQTLHMIFAGNPGTGKTMLAKKVAKILFNIGIISTDKVVETDRSGLVAGYIGQTAIKTREVIESALDGVLFIDEAYTLAQGGSNDFGQEAIDMLVKMMDEHRERLVVILAGYKEDMESFLKANAGLKSRFPTIVPFDDYSVEELIDISERFYASEGYILTDTSLKLMKNIFENEKRYPQFGNGRFVRNLYEASKTRQALRLFSCSEYNDEELMTITDSDIKEAALQLCGYSYDN